MMNVLTSHLVDGGGQLPSRVAFPLPALSALPAVRACARPLHQRTHHRNARRLSLISAAIANPPNEVVDKAHSENLPSLGDADASSSAAAGQQVTAVIVGASMAGLLTAAALAPWCKEVLVIDKDEFADDAATVHELQEEVGSAPGICLVVP